MQPVRDQDHPDFPSQVVLPFTHDVISPLREMPTTLQSTRKRPMRRPSGLVFGERNPAGTLHRRRNGGQNEVTHKIVAYPVCRRFCWQPSTRRLHRSLPNVRYEVAPPPTPLENGANYCPMSSRAPEVGNTEKTSRDSLFRYTCSSPLQPVGNTTKVSGE